MSLKKHLLDTSAVLKEWREEARHIRCLPMYAIATLSGVRRSGFVLLGPSGVVPTEAAILVLGEVLHSMRDQLKGGKK